MAQLADIMSNPAGDKAEMQDYLRSYSGLAVQKCLVQSSAEIPLKLSPKGSQNA
jgi:hypothetical protein